MTIFQTFNKYQFNLTFNFNGTFLADYIRRNCLSGITDVANFPVEIEKLININIKYGIGVLIYK